MIPPLINIDVMQVYSIKMMLTLSMVEILLNTQHLKFMVIYGYGIASVDY